MTNKEIDLVIEMLRDYSDRLGNAGCNDTPNEWVAPFTREELNTLNREFEEYNGSPEDYEPDRKWPLPDYCYVGLMRSKLEALKK